MKVKKKKLHSILEMIDSGAYCNDVYFNYFSKSCKPYESNELVECSEKCPFYNVENMMKWLKEGE